MSDLFFSESLAVILGHVIQDIFDKKEEVCFL